MQWLFLLADFYWSRLLVFSGVGVAYGRSTLPCGVSLNVLFMPCTQCAVESEVLAFKTIYILW